MQIRVLRSRKNEVTTCYSTWDNCTSLWSTTSMDGSASDTAKHTNPATPVLYGSTKTSVIVSKKGELSWTRSTTSRTTVHLHYLNRLLTSRYPGKMSLRDSVLSVELPENGVSWEWDATAYAASLNSPASSDTSMDAAISPGRWIHESLPIALTLKVLKPITCRFKKGE